MAVRYDKKFLTEINRVVSSYNRKINRLSKIESDYVLPQKFSAEALKALKRTATSRAEIRRKLADLQSFTARGGEKNIRVGISSIPKYQYTNIKRYQRLLKIQTSRKMRQLETRRPIANGVEQPYTFSQYGSQEYLTLKAKRMNLADKDLSNLTRSEIQSYLDKLVANTKKKDLGVWQENYLSILEDTGLSYGYDPDKLDVIVSKLKDLTPTEFDDLSFINRNIQAILYSYKGLEDIQTANELSAVSEDVVRNLDSIYENLDDILAKYV